MSGIGAKLPRQQLAHCGRSEAKQASVELLPQEAIDILGRLRRRRGALLQLMTKVDSARLCRRDIEVMEGTWIHYKPYLRASATQVGQPLLTFSRRSPIV